MSPIELNPAMPSATATPPAAEAEPKPATREMSLAQIAAECATTMPLSVQSVYAGMQLEQAKLCKDAAQRKAKDMQEIQEKQAEMAQLIQAARNSQAANGEMMPPSLINRMRELGLPVELGDPKTGHLVKNGKTNSIEALVVMLERAAMDEYGLFNDIVDPNIGNSQRTLRRRDFQDLAKLLREKMKNGTGEGFMLDDNEFAQYMNVMKTFDGLWDLVKDGKLNLDPINKQNLDSLVFSSRDIVETGASHGYSMDKDKWEYNMKSLSNYQEQIGSRTQSTMVSLQDFLGQYNSFLQGANAAITEAIRLQSKLNSGEQ